jgi:hypothetical protein
MKTQDHPLTRHATPSSTPTRAARAAIRKLVGSGDRIGLLVLPFLVVGIALNLSYPSLILVQAPPGPTHGE